MNTAALPSDPTLPTELQALAGQAVLVAQAMAQASGDLVLVLDAGGRVVAAFAGETSSAPVAQACPDWLGHSWVDTVAPDSRAKVGRMLHDLDLTGQARRREINALGRVDSPTTALDCRAIRLGPQGPSLVIGRDLAGQSRLQQRFVQAQGQLETSYWQMRSE